MQKELADAAADCCRAGKDRCVGLSVHTTFPATTPGFESLMTDFLAAHGNLVQGPYLSVALPFRKHLGKTPFDWLTGFVAHSHQARLRAPGR